jgi:hypothetical protein
MLKYTDLTQNTCIRKLNGYGDNGNRKVWASVGSTYCTPSLTPYSSTAHARQRDITVHCSQRKVALTSQDDSCGLRKVIGNLRTNTTVVRELLRCKVQILILQKPHIPASFNIYLVINK